MTKSDLRHQPNVAGIVRNARGEILVCERLGMDGAWQFPQGGVDDGESAEAALRRELGEEVGLRKSDYRIVERRGPYRYLFGDGKKKKGFHGKEQVYFLLDLTDQNARIDLHTHHPEFQAYRWIRPEAFRLEWLPEAKREVYRQVFLDFFGLKLQGPKQ